MVIATPLLRIEQRIHRKNKDPCRTRTQDDLFELACVHVCACACVYMCVYWGWADEGFVLGNETTRDIVG